MNNPTLSPRPTRSTLRNRRIILDLKSSINGSYVGENGLKGAARRSELPKAERNEVLTIILGAGAILAVSVALALIF